MNNFWSCLFLFGTFFVVSTSSIDAHDAILSTAEAQSITHFLNKKPKHYFTKKKGALPPKLTNLKYPIERDARTGRIYVHLKGHPDAHLGKGYFKQVTKALLYPNRKSKVPRVVACCRTKKSANEIKALKKLQGVPGVVKLYSVFKRSGTVSDIFLEYCNDRSLLKCEYGKVAIAESDYLSFFEDVLQGLKGIHNRGYVHRDLHGGNILLNRSASGRLSARIIDFGHAKTVKEMLGTEACRSIPQYLTSPELLLYRRAQVAPKKVETYALGVTLYTALNLRRPKWCGLISDILNKRSKKADRRKVYHETVRLWNESGREEQAQQRSPLRKSLDALVHQLICPYRKDRLTLNQALQRVRELQKQHKS